MHVLENTPQASTAWHAARAKHLCASEAAAALGLSKYTTRDELLRQKATGLTEEVSPAKQRIFDAGHEAEALARPLAEGIAGTEFYPVVATREVDGLPLLASFDGIDLLDEVIWENKLLNQSLVQQVRAGDLSPHYYLQLEHQLLVSGAQRALFTTSDGTPEGTHPLWYESKPERRAQLIAGWKQFAEDLADYTPPEAAPAPAMKKVVASLPVVFDMRVEGKLIACNLEQYKPAALAYIEAINTKLATDQDFADADADARFCRDSADKLELAVEQAMGHMGDVNTALNTVREIAAAFDAKGLALEKLVKAQKDNIKLTEVLRGQKEMAEHIAQLNAAMPAAYMPQVPTDFAGAVKNKRTVDSLRGAVNDELARAKIAASEIANRIHANVKTLQASGLVVHDAAALVLKAPDDLVAIIATRVAAEQARIDGIRKEEAEKLKNEQAGKQAPALTEQAQAAIKTVALTEQVPPTPEGLRGSYQRAWAAPEAVVESAASAAPPAEADSGARINLGGINDHLAPICLTGAGLAQLGFEPVEVVKAARLYRACDLPAIRAALISHLSGLALQAATA